MLRGALLGLAGSSRARQLAVAAPVTRQLVERFVAGETVDDAVRAAAALVSDGLVVSVDRLGEDVADPTAAAATVTGYLDLLAALDRAGIAGAVEVSCKLSALGAALPDGPARALDLAGQIADAAADVGTTMTVDMEDHTTTDVVLGTVMALRERHSSVGAVLQAALRRTPADAQRLATAGSRVRLCKGAYDEPGTVAHTSAAEVDKAYVRVLRTLINGPGYPMVATHDPRLLAIAAALATTAGRSADSIEYQMLYGVRPAEQRRLAAQGRRVRVYLPYGTDWWRYLLRRLGERPANLALLGRALTSRD